MPIMICLLCQLSYAYSQVIPIDTLIQNFESYFNNSKPEKSYLQTDRQIYFTGDTIYFSGLIVDGITHKPGTSRALYVDLINSQKQLILNIALQVDSLGRTKGDFTLADSLKAGTYYLRAYTGYQKNFDPSFYYSQSIKVLSLNSGPILSENIQEEDMTLDFQLFPEGGDLLTGTNNFIAFKAIDDNQHPVEINGIISNDLNEQVGSFKSQIDGMGLFIVYIKPNRKYFCKYTYKGKVYQKELPKALDTGFYLHVRNSKDYLQVSVKSINCDFENTFLLLQCRGKVIDVHEVLDLSKHEVFFTLNRSDLPSGIIQITFFDKYHRPTTERLVFNENPNHIHPISLKLDQSVYTKREQVKLTHKIESTNTETITLTTSVVPKKLYSKSENTIQSYLLLSSDLKGDIINPSQYFNPTDPNRIINLDLIMLTHGWSRFIWKDIINNNISNLNFAYETGLTFSGRVTTYSDKERGVASDIYFSYLENPFFKQYNSTDNDGYFTFQNLIFHDTITALIKTVSPKERKKNLDKVKNNTSIHIDNLSPPITSISSYGFNSPINTSNIKQLSLYKHHLIEQEKFDLDSAIILKPVKVNNLSPLEKALRKRSISHMIPNRRIFIDSVTTLPNDIFNLIISRIPWAHKTYKDGYESLEMKLPLLELSRQKVGLTYVEPVFIVDGFITEASLISSISPTDVLFIDIVRPPASGVYGDYALNNTAICIYLRRAEEYNNSQEAEGLIFFKTTGFYSSRKFYKPEYSQSNTTSTTANSDIRNTLHWEPNLIIKNEIGKIDFYTSDETGEFIIYSEGISTNGELYYGKTTFTVE